MSNGYVIVLPPENKTCNEEYDYLIYRAKDSK
jgi:hypothetical protein